MLLTTDPINYFIYIICRQPKCIKIKHLLKKNLRACHINLSPKNYQKFTDLLLKMTHTQRKFREARRFYTITLCTLLHFINKTTILMLWTRRTLSPTSAFCVALLLYLVCYCRPSSATAFPSIQCEFGKWCVGEEEKKKPWKLYTKILRPLHLHGGKRLQHNSTTQTEQENIKPQTPTEGKRLPLQLNSYVFEILTGI